MADAFVCGQRHGGGDASGPVDVAGQTALHEFRLELGVDHVRLDHRIHVVFIDLDDAVHAPQVQLDATRSPGVTVDAPAGAGGLELDVELVAEADDGLHLFGGCRHNDGLETGLKVLRHSRLAGAPCPGIQIHGVLGDVLRPDDGLEGLVVLSC